MAINASHFCENVILTEPISLLTVFDRAAVAGDGGSPRDLLTWTFFAS